jgi:hypothetical protein
VLTAPKFGAALYGGEKLTNGVSEYGQRVVKAEMDALILSVM